MANINVKEFMMLAVGLIVSTILVTGVLIPVIGDASTTTISIENEGASWMRYDMKNSIVGTDISVTEDSGNITITNGTDSQSNELSDALIIYAGSNGSVYYDGTNMIVLSKNNDATTYGTLTGSFTVREINGSVIASDGTNTYDLGTPTWAYVPSSVGQYAMFNDTGFKTWNRPLASISQTYAGVSAYNDIINMDIGLTQNVTMDGENVDSVTWIIRSVEPLPELTPIDPERITIQPLDPSIIDPIDLGGGNATIMAVPTPTYTEGDWGYDLTTIGGVQKAVIVSYSGTSGAVTVPATIGGYPVHAFGKMNNTASNVNVFNNTISYTDLIFNDGIEVINKYVCNSCKFTGNLTLPSTLKIIDNSAFEKCGFTGNLVIPDGVTTIGIGAFKECKGFTGNLVIPDSVTSIGISAFQWSNGMKGTLTISNNITSIPSSVFDTCYFTGNLVIPDSVTTIGDTAFNYCTGFTGNLVIPDSVTSIGSSAFSYCRFTGNLVIPDSVTTIGSSAFKNCQYITGISFSSRLSTIPNNCFQNCYGLLSLNLPDNITSIGNSAFSSCANITGNLVIPDGVTSIGSSAFNGCGGFTGNLVIPDSVTTINGYAFQNCTGLTGNLVIPDSVTTIGDWAFGSMGVSNLIISADSGTTISGTSAFKSPSIKSILNLGSLELTTTSYGMSADSVQDHLDAIGFIAPANVKEVVRNEGAVWDILAVIPLFIVILLVIGTVTLITWRR